LKGYSYIFFDNIAEKCHKELEIIALQYPFEPLKYLKPTLRLKYPDAIALLREAGVTEEQQPSLEDLSTATEKLLGKLVKAKYNTDFFVLDKFPSVARPFYTMLDPHDERYSNSYDIFLRGEEIVSGSQRVHDAVLLEQRVRAKGITVETVQSYIDAFKYGAPPHGGCGIGLERVIMLYLGLDNIRKTSLFPRDPKRLTP